MPFLEAIIVTLMCPPLQTGGVGVQLVNSTDTENGGEVLLKGKSSLYYQNREGAEFLRKKLLLSSRIREGETKDGM